MGKQISSQRKVLHYLGLTLVAAGVLTFASTFVSFAAGGQRFGDGPPKQPLVGMGLLVLGGILTAVGSRGLAGSGVLLDPERAREDLEPFSRMAGGMLKDALDEADVRLGDTAPERVVMLKCRACGKLNEDDSKFCQECGQPL